MTPTATVLATTKLRQGRVTPGQRAAHARLWPAYGLHLDSPVDVAALFGRSAPLVVEVGSGMGEATAALAEAEPESDVLACELHLPGQGSLLRRVEEAGLTNVRVVAGDGRVLLAGLPDGSVDVVRVFFPDPWPKSKHWKRRLVGDAFARLVVGKLRPGGLVHVATDWTPYAAQVRRVLTACPRLVETVAPARPRTRFEQQGLDAGRTITDLAFQRRVRAAPTPG